jgi:transmembrane sensor
VDLSVPPAGRSAGPQADAASALDQAVQWAVRLQSGMAGEAERHACAAWRSASPLHEEAWTRVQAVEQVFGAVPAGSAHAARQALEAAAQAGGKPASRRRALSLLGVGALAAISAGLAARLAPWSEESAYASRAGERRQVVLADGTRLQLNARTVVDVTFTPLQRLLVLREGEIFIDTGADAHAFAGKRPFWVQAGQVRLQALGTAFAVEQAALAQATPTQLHVRQGLVAIHLEGKAPVLAQAGETYRISDGDRSAPVVRVLQPESDPTAWLDGALVAKRMRLDAFAAALSRYHREPVFCDAGAAALRVSGVFQLDGPQAAERALDALAATLPVRIERTGKGEPIIALR